MFFEEVMLGEVFFTYVAPSSSGLGRWPLTPETRVRVPLGSLLFLWILRLV